MSWLKVEDFYMYTGRCILSMDTYCKVVQVYMFVYTEFFNKVYSTCNCFASKEANSSRPDNVLIYPLRRSFHHHQIANGLRCGKFLCHGFESTAAV